LQGDWSSDVCSSDLRKVFLYPENYIEPGLRDDKTPLFRELEDTLLQQEINDATVGDAYARYIATFDELAHLQIAGACYDSAADRSEERRVGKECRAR